MPNENQDDAFNLGLMNDRLAFRVRRLLTLLGDRVIEAFKPFELRSGSFTTLALIAANDGCSQIDLAREGGLDPSVLVSIVDELEKRGLAQRTRSAVDRRRSSLHITPLGKKTMQEMFVVATKTENAVRDVFSANEMVDFIGYLDRAHEALSSGHQPTS